MLLSIYRILDNLDGVFMAISMTVEKKGLKRQMSGVLFTWKLLNEQ